MSEASSQARLYNQLVDHINSESLGVETKSPVCDYCNYSLDPGDRVTSYISDAELGGEKEPCPETGLYVHRLYCEDCERENIVYPHAGTKELLFSASLTEDGDLTDGAIEDRSGADEGESWNPGRAYQFVFGDYAKFVEQANEKNVSVSHEDISDMIRLTGINFRELFDEGGNLIAPETKQEQIQSRAESHLHILHQEVASDPQDQQLLRRQLGGFTCVECGATATCWAEIEHQSNCTSYIPANSEN